MKITTALKFALAGLVTAGISASAWADMKYSTEIPANVITPDRTETRIGTLEFVDGFPSRQQHRRSGTTWISRVRWRS